MKKRVSFFLCCIVLCFCCNAVMAEEAYSIEDFKIGTLYRMPNGSYNDLDSFLQLSEKGSPGGIDYWETKAVFPGGKDYWISDHTAFDKTVFFDWCERSDSDKEKHPILTVWELIDGDRFGILWRKNKHGIIEPYSTINATSIPDASIIRNLDLGYTANELRVLNPFIIENEHNLPNGILALFPYGVIHSVWHKGEKLIVYSHLINYTNGKTKLHYRDYYLENKLQGLVGLFAMAFE